MSVQVTTPARIWSPKQKAIFDWFSNGTGNLVVRARAGTGKTTTILQGVRYVRSGDILITTFGRRITDELKAKNQSKIAVVLGMHQVGLSCLTRKFGHVEVNKRPWTIADRALKEADLIERTEHEKKIGMPKVSRRTSSLVSFYASTVKNCAPFAKTVAEVLEAVAPFEDAILSAEDVYDGWTPERIAKYAIQALEEAKLDLIEEGLITFDDMLWLPISMNLTYACYDTVVVDEAQDLNPVMLELALRMRKPAARVCVVGDDRQACYSFRGADTNALDRLKRELKAEELPLNITYRCARKIVAEAQRLVPDLEVREGAPEGVIRTVGKDALQKEIANGDFVLSRTNAALVVEFLSAAKAGKSVRIAGREKEFANGLADFIMKIQKNPFCKLDQFVDDCADWVKEHEKELATAPTKSAKRRLTQAKDKVDALKFFARGLAEESSRFTTQDLRLRLEKVFDTSKKPEDSITFSTIHSAKGLEARRVFILSETLYLYGNVLDDEEKNLEYIAITRAKEELVWVGRKLL